MTIDAAPFNPLDKRQLGESVAEALLKSDPHPLGSVGRFNGAGIYALYFTGDFSCYRTLSPDSSMQGPCVPIYVGKAVPPGARRGNFGIDAEPGPALFNRIREHAESIRSVQNLSREDFHCRYLVVEDIWIPLGEALLIARFTPVWNKLVDGFGNHDPGSGRYNQLRSRWDVLHPGRSWAEKCKQREETSEQIIAEVSSYFLSNPPFPLKVESE